MTCFALLALNPNNRKPERDWVADDVSITSLGSPSRFRGFGTANRHEFAGRTCAPDFAKIVSTAGQFQNAIKSGILHVLPNDNRRRRPDGRGCESYPFRRKSGERAICCLTTNQHFNRRQSRLRGLCLKFR